jgi:hypothetical protein
MATGPDPWYHGVMTNIKNPAVSILLVIATCWVLPHCGDGGGGESDADAEAPETLPDPAGDPDLDPGEDPAPDDGPVDDPVQDDAADVDQEEVVIGPVLFEHVVIDEDGPVNVWQKCAGDLSGDGRVDLVAGGNDSGGLVWYENPGWAKHEIAPGGGHSTDCEIADVDRDGDLDVVSVHSSGLRWYENPGWAVHEIESRTLHDVEVADLDGDGDVDAAARNQSAFGGDGNVLHFYRQDSPGAWTHAETACAHGEGLVLADLDGDDDDDTVVNASWFENTGDALDGWTEHAYSTAWTQESVFADTGDMNGDGRQDIVLSPSELAGGTYRISWFEAPSDPTAGDWTEHVVEDGVETVHHFVAAADMDLSGQLDIVTAEMHQGEDPDEVRQYLNEGGGLEWLRQVIAETGSHSMRAVDVDGDGDVDLYGANWQGNQVDLWVNGTISP